MITVLLPVAAALAACIAVDGDRILMKDMAAARPEFAAAGPGEPAGYAPAPGARRTFRAAELRRIAQAHGITLAPGPDICFERRTDPLRREDILTSLSSSIPAGVQMELLDYSRQPVPRGDLEFPKSGLGPGSAARSAIWRGRVRYGAGRSVPVWVKVRLAIRRTLVVAAADLPQGKTIRADQLKIETRDEFPSGASLAKYLDEVAGRVSRRLIRAGEPVPAASLKPAKDVEPGETVVVEVESGAALLKVDAMAETGGHLGEYILLRNSESGKRFRGRITAKGKALVQANQSGGKNENGVPANVAGRDASGDRECGKAKELAHTDRFIH